MAELKTKPTEAGVKEYLDTIDDPRRRADSAAMDMGFVMTFVSPSHPTAQISRNGWRIFHGRPTGFVVNIPPA